MNGWGTDNALAYIGRGVYQADLSLDEQSDAYLFKIASEDWATVNFGAMSERRHGRGPGCRTHTSR